MAPKHPNILILVSVLILQVTSFSDVIINEISTKQTERALRWDERNQPFSGTWPAWWMREFDNSEWIFAFAYNKAYEQNDSTTMKKLGTDYISYMIAKVKYYEEQSNKLFRKNIKQVLLIHANLLNADYLGYLLKAINEYDYKFITLDETISDKAYETENNYVGRYGPSWIHRWALTKGADESFFAGNPKIPNYIKDYTNIRYE